MRFTQWISFVTLFVVYAYGSQPVVVQTQYGDVLGYQTDLARVFYGIPFAQPPTDALRWKPPTPVAKWYPNVINATQPAPACAQTPNIVYRMYSKMQMSEDCLYLNIFTPLTTNTSSNQSLPVMLFIHGGGFQAGSASDSIYEAEHMVNTTNVVVALIQYRLGVFGFFATGNGPNDIQGNYGILDQRLAIAWVKANIEAFGGNPNEITLFGQSAGAQSTTLHYLTSDMQSYFQRAIIQSSPMTIPFRSYMEYVTAGVLLAEQLHCASGDIPCFRSRSTDQIIAAQAAVNTMLTSFNPLFFFEPWLPVIDNVIVNGTLLDMLFKTTFPLKQLIIGTTTDECYDFVYGMWGKPITTANYLALATFLFKNNGLKVIQRYPPDSSGDQRLVVAHVCTQWVFACSTRRFARKAASYSYVFGYPYNSNNIKTSLGCTNHACHGDELSYEFEAFWTNLTDSARRVSQSMATYWTNFAESQDPNEPLNVPLAWPRVTTEDEKYMYIQDPLSVEQNYLKSDCDFWDEIGYKTFF